jgi:tetratricopeptide (TPR) repeat protein
MNPPQLKAGEHLDVNNGQVRVSSQISVMMVNGLLTKVIFDHNPENEFYVEESFPLDWMFPHLTPYGVIMKINRKPLATLPPDVFDRDHRFWKEYAKRFTGDVVDYDTKVSDVAAFVEKTYLRKNFKGFTGDRKFVRDEDAQKAFSKLRSAIGGIYAYRLGIPGSPTLAPEYRAKTQEDKDRLIKEANFAYLQAFLFCPYSPDAIYRYVNFLMYVQRFNDAVIVVETGLKFDPNNGQLKSLLDYLKSLIQNNGATTLEELEAQVTKKPNDLSLALTLLSAYEEMKQIDKAIKLADSIESNPKVDVQILKMLARFNIQNARWQEMERIMAHITRLQPGEPENWYDLTVIRTTLGMKPQAVEALSNALHLSSARLKTNPKARDMEAIARKDTNLMLIRDMPEFKKLLP